MLESGTVNSDGGQAAAIQLFVIGYQLLVGAVSSRVNDSNNQ
jgi:hypothetical protein